MIEDIFTTTQRDWDGDTLEPLFRKRHQIIDWYKAMKDISNSQNTIQEIIVSPQVYQDLIKLQDGT